MQRFRLERNASVDVNVESTTAACQGENRDRGCAGYFGAEGERTAAAVKTNITQLRSISMGGPWRSRRARKRVTK